VFLCFEPQVLSEGLNAFARLRFARLHAASANESLPAIAGRGNAEIRRSTS
jgi:hypothetical protein